MNKDLIELFNKGIEGKTQRILAKETGFSLGKINKLLSTAEVEGFVVESNINKDKTKDFKTTNAIILAAGYGLRMLPINREIPKALLNVKGETLIERLIKQLQEKEIRDIAIVVGFQKEKFEYLIDKYNIKLVVNADYAISNNSLSLYLAKEQINGTYIVPGDLYFFKNPFNYYEYDSWYMLSTNTDGKGYYSVNKKGCLVKGDKQRHNAVGVSYISKKDSKELIDNLENVIDGYQQAFWEEAFFAKKNMNIHAKFIEEDLYKEINTYENLREIDINSEHLKNDSIKCIMDVFGVKNNEIKNISMLKKGMTNRSFIFSIDNNKYIMRVPGEGTEKLINREEEYKVYQQVNPLNICDELVYMNPKTGVKITKYYENAHNCNPEDKKEVKNCIEFLKKIHNSKIKVDFIFDIFNQIDYYEKLRGPESLYCDYNEVKKSVLKLKDFIEKNKGQYCLCHIDSVYDNFLIGENGIKLIDWEYSAMQDPHVDIAMFAIYAGYDKVDIDELIQMYFGKDCKETDRLLVYSYVSVCGLLWSNWCEYKHSLGLEFKEYSIMQYRYGKTYAKIVHRYLGANYIRVK